MYRRRPGNPQPPRRPCPRAESAPPPPIRETSIDAIAKGWALRWQARGWINNENRPTSHAELWGQLLGLCSYHEVTFVWLPFNQIDKGEYASCDLLAHGAAQSLAAGSKPEGRLAGDSSEAQEIHLASPKPASLLPKVRCSDGGSDWLVWRLPPVQSVLEFCRGRNAIDLLEHSLCRNRVGTWLAGPIA
jgi:hypothetical protein